MASSCYRRRIALPTEGNLPITRPVGNYFLADKEIKPPSQPSHGKLWESWKIVEMMPLFQPKMCPFDAFLAKREASAERLFNPHSNHVKITM